VGGDTTKYPGVIASITVIGEIDPGRAILRSGARPGDLVCVTGRLGAAELGLRLIQKALHKKKQWKRLTTKHFYPEPRLAVGQWLVARRFASAMIDTSDGLSTDLGRLCKASAVGARLWADKLPLASVPPGLKRQGFDPLELAIDGGEDYELLFTVPKRLTPGLPSRVANLPVTVIGEITREKNVTLINSKGGVTALQPQGWDPFRRL
jgi:thiamine-monophosphate kinase